MADKAKNKRPLALRLVAEWHPTKNGDLRPTDVTPWSKKDIWWVCANAHEWQATVAHRSSGQSCPYCAGQRVSLEMSLGTNFPRVAQEWHPQKNGELTSFHVMPKSSKKFWWICDKGHEWRATPSNRVKGSGCPYCAGRRPSPENNLATKDPNLTRQWHPTKNRGLTPFDVVPGNQKKVWWLCEYGHEWEDSPYNRRGSKSCPYCVNKRVSATNNLAGTEP